MQIHELNNYSGDIGSDSFLAVDNGSDTGKVSAQQLLASTEAEITALDTALNARIDNIIAGGDAPSAAEVTDARLGASDLGSVQYDSLGDAIRGQATLLNDKTVENSDNIEEKIGKKYQVVRTGGSRYTLYHNFKAGEKVTVKYVSYTGPETTSLGLRLQKTGENPVNVFPNGIQYNSIGSEGSFIVPPEADGYESLFFMFNNGSNAYTYTAEVTIGWNDHDRRFIPNDLYIGKGQNINGTLFNHSKRATTAVIPYDRPITVSVKAGIGIAYMVGSVNTSLTDKGYIVTIAQNTDGAVVTIDEDPSTYNCISLSFASNDAFNSADDIGLTITPALGNLGNLIDKWADPMNNASILSYRSIIGEFDDLTTMSDTTATLAVSDGFDIDDKGNVYLGLAYATNAVREYGNPNWSGALLKGNVADLQGTKEQVETFQRGAQYASINGQIENVQTMIAKVTDEDEVTIIGNLIYRDMSDQTVQYRGYVARKYTPSTGVFSNPEICTIDVNGTTYNMISKFNDVNGWVIDAASQANIEAIWSATGIEHPVGYGGSNSYQYYIGNNPFKYNGEWYQPICLGNQSHALCKTSDLINWEYVCDIPFGQASEECCVCIYKSKVYATSRGNYEVDSQNSKIMMCNFSELDGDHWSTPITLFACRNERPTIAALNDIIYVMQGRPQEQETTEGVAIPRAHKVLLTFDKSLNQLTRNELAFVDPMLLHPQFMSFGGALWISESTDKRCFGFTSSGDTRSEISFGRADAKILAMQC